MQKLMQVKNRMIDKEDHALVLEMEEEKEQFQNFMLLMNIKQKKRVHTKLMKLRRRQIMAYHMQKVLNEALLLANEDVAKDKKRAHLQLKSLWNYMNIEPIEPYVKFFLTPDNISFKKKMKMSALWKIYQISENGRTSIFAPMERIKLVNSWMNKTVNVNYLIEENFVVKSFALNDNYELLGRSMMALFEQIFEKSKLGSHWKRAQLALNFYVSTKQNPLLQLAAGKKKKKKKKK